MAGAIFFIGDAVLSIFRIGISRFNGLGVVSFGNG